jgi:hypothetical protein
MGFLMEAGRGAAIAWFARYADAESSDLEG